MAVEQTATPDDSSTKKYTEDTSIFEQMAPTSGLTPFGLSAVSVLPHRCSRDQYLNMETAPSPADVAFTKPYNSDSPKLRAIPLRRK